MDKTKKRRIQILAASVFWLGVWQAAAVAIGQEVFLVSPVQAIGTLVELLPQAGHSSTGMSDESVQTVFAQVEKDEAAHPEHGELIEVFTLPLREVPRFLKQNPLPLGTRLQLVLEIFARNAK